MKENRNIKNIFQKLVFTFIAFFIFGAVSVNAETVMVKDEKTFTKEFANIDSTSDVVVLARDINLSTITTKRELNIYKDKTIDLNGHSLTFPEYLIVLLYQTDATVKFIDSSSSKTGKILGTNITSGYPMINIANANKTTNDDGITTTETYLVFDGIKFEGNNANASHAVGNFDTSKIKKVSFINCDISNFAYLNDGREADNFYYENITFKRETGTGYLVSIGKKIDDVISNDSEIIKENTEGAFLEKYSDRNTLMSSVSTRNDVIKVRYIDGFTVSNVSLKETLGYSSSTGKNITITNRGTSNLKIESVEVSDNAKFIIEKGNKDEIAAGASDNSWIIKARDGVPGGVYTSVITIKGSNGKSYSANVTLEVEEIEDGYKTIYVTNFDELKDAIDGIKYAIDGNYVTDTSIRKVKLGSNIVIPKGKTLVFNLINDFVLDLNGYTIDGYTNDRSIVLKYGNNTLDDFDNGGLTIIDSSASQSGSIKLGMGAIDIQQENLNDSAKNYKLIINGGKYYQSYGVNSYFINFNNSNTYWKDKNISFDFKVNKGYFEFENGISNGKILLAQDFTNNNQNVILSILFNNVTLKGRSGYLVYANDKEYTYNDITPDGTDLYIFNSAGKQKLIDDKSISAKASVDYNKYKSDPDFSAGYYESLKISKKQGFEVAAPTFDKVKYGYSTVAGEAISITNIGENSLGIKNVTVSGSEADAKFRINSVSGGIVEPGKTDTTWKIYPVEGLNAGTYEAVITVIDTNDNPYTTTVKFVVEPKELTNLGIELSSTIPYSDPINPTFTGIEELSESDYEVTYYQKDGDRYQEIFFKPNKVGSYKVTISITNENYVNISASVPFDIVAKEIDPKIDVISDKTYTGSQIKPNIYVRYDVYQFKLDEDYTLEYGENINVGNGTVIVKAIEGSNFTWDDKEVTFKIVAKSLTDSNVILNQNSFKHTGGEIKPVPVVKDGENILEEDTDYTLSYDNNINIGENTGEVIVTGIGNYKGKVTKYFSIIKRNPQVISFNEPLVSKTYGDSSFKIEANHTVGNGNIKYTSTNTDVATVDEATGKVAIKKAGDTTIKATALSTTDYAQAEATYKLEVKKKELSYRATVSDKEFDNNENATVSNIIFTGLVGSETLTKDTDYTVTAKFVSTSVDSDINVNVTVTLKDTVKANNYNLTNTNYVAKANITGKEILAGWITIKEDTYTYDGTQKKPTVTVKVDGTELRKDTDYIVTYGENINAGEGTLKVKGTGNYFGEVQKDFTINKKSIILKISDIANVTYSGSQYTPKITVKDGENILEEDTDYTVTYGENINAGKGKIFINSVASSNYAFGETTKTFNINKYTIQDSNITLEYETVLYDGTNKEPEVTVKFKNITIPKSEYVVTYSADHKSVGTASATVTMKDTSTNFEGSATKQFEIVDKTPLTITGIFNQEVTYTGSPVELVGTLLVDHDINVSDLTVKWYKDDTEIDRPTNVGEYKVVYSYEDDTYKGSLTVNVTITKKESIIPSVNLLKGLVGDKLSTITLPDGFKWVNSNEEIVAGNKEYTATYTTNNDTTNYTTLNVLIKVYGNSKVNLNTSVNGLGGTISPSKTNILEGTTETIIFTPNTGFMISKVEVNGVDKTANVVDNKLDVVIDNNDLSVVVTYKVIECTITINGVSNVTINPSGIIKVDYNSSKEITIKADLGYKLVSVKVNGVEKVDDIVNDKLILENILADTEIVVVAQKNVYEVIEGANQKYTINEDKEAKFKIDAEYVYFERGGSVYIDDVLVDPLDYTAKEGTIIILKKNYLNKLTTGEHTLKVLFTNGEATTIFTVAKLSSEENPKTRDNIGLYILTGIISTLGLAFAGTYIYKRKQTN